MERGTDPLYELFSKKRANFCTDLLNCPIASPKRTQGMAWTEKEMEMGVAATQFYGAAVIDLFIGF